MRRSTHHGSRPRSLAVQSLESRRFLSGVPLGVELGIVAPARFAVDRPTGDASTSQLSATLNPTLATADLGTGVEGSVDRIGFSAAGSAFWDGPMATPRLGVGPELSGASSAVPVGLGFDTPARPVAGLRQQETNIVAMGDRSAAPARERTTGELRALDQAYSSHSEELLSSPAGAGAARARSGMGQPLEADGSY